MDDRRTIRGFGSSQNGRYLTREQRSYCMSRVRNRDTAPEQSVRRALHRLGYRFRKHDGSLPARPDVVFASRKVVVFIDGDFLARLSVSRVARHGFVVLD